MQGVGAKLSKHVLGMKFMRKTKDQLDKDKVVKTHREHFTSDVSCEEGSTPRPLTAIVEEVPSYSQCIGYNYGRISFGGFNPTVEFNVSNGIWKAVHAGVNESDEEVETDEAAEKDIPDEEMARTYGSLIGTLGKHFMKKKDRNTDQGSNNEFLCQEDTNQHSQNQCSRKQKKQADGNRDNMIKKAFGWKKDRGWKKNKKIPDPEPSQNNKSSFQNQFEKNSGGPPQKKRKFLKPDD